MDCKNCNHFYYDSGGGGQCDAPYENSCLRAHHYFHTCLTELFTEEHLDIKLYPWQKTTLKMFEGDKINARTASRYISRR